MRRVSIVSMVLLSGCLWIDVTTHERYESNPTGKNSAHEIKWMLASRYDIVILSAGR